MKFNGKDITELLAINRRNFIKLIVGGAVGTGLSPIPWKLADDSSIFSQNFPWVPVPPVGEFTTEKTVCKLCPGGCGIEVRKVDNRAVKIEGRTDYPVNPGGICPLGMGGLQLLYNEGNRFTGPAKRIGPRGSGEYMNISWDEAIDTLSKRLSALRNQGRPEAIVAVDGNPVQSTMSVIIERLLRSIGSSNYMRIPSAEDTSRLVNELMYGNKGPVSYDLENSDYVLSFGCGLLEGWGSPGRVINTWSLWHSPGMKGNVKIVQIESRASNTASKADKWIAAKPGTEAALALGIANVMIREGLYNTDFIDNSSFGFTDWTTPDDERRMGFKKMVIENYSPDTVEEITGVSAKDIITIARDFARARAPIAICGKGKGNLNESLYDFMSIHALNALAGNINMPGGIFVHLPLPFSALPDIELDSTANKGVRKGRIDKAGPFGQSLLNNLVKAIADEDKSPVDTILAFSANPAFTLPDGGEFRRAMDKVPFIVSFSPYHDDTAFLADLVLPDHTYLEKTDDIIWPRGLQYPLCGLTRPVIDPLYDTKNTGDVILRLAKNLGGSIGNAFPWKDYEEILKIRFRGLYQSAKGLTSYNPTAPAWKQVNSSGFFSSDYVDFDNMWKQMKSGGLWYSPVSPDRNRETIFKTSTGKFEFFSNQIKLALKDRNPKAMGVNATGDEVYMPHYEPVHSDEGEHKSTLTMVPYELINLASNWVPNPPYLNKTLFDDQLLKDESFVEINPETALELGLKDGDRAHIESENGDGIVRIKHFEGAMPGTVYMPLGFGHRAYDDFSRGKGINPNEIIDADRIPLTGQPLWWNTQVKLTKA